MTKTYQTGIKLSEAVVHLNLAGACIGFEQLRNLIAEGHVKAKFEGGKWLMTQEQLADAKLKLCSEVVC